MKQMHKQMKITSLAPTSSSHFLYAEKETVLEKQAVFLSIQQILLIYTCQNQHRGRPLPEMLQRPVCMYGFPWQLGFWTLCVSYHTGIFFFFFALAILYIVFPFILLPAPYKVGTHTPRKRKLSFTKLNNWLSSIQSLSRVQLFATP